MVGGRSGGGGWDAGDLAGDCVATDRRVHSEASWQCRAAGGGAADGAASRLHITACVGEGERLYKLTGGEHTIAPGQGETG